MIKIKNFLCNTDPSNIVFPIIILIMLGCTAAYIGIMPFLLITSVGLLFIASLAAIGYGLYRAVAYLQTKCKE